MEYYVGIDLGTTNIKAVAYDADMRLAASASLPVSYTGEGGFVEFDAESYFDGLTAMLGDMLRTNGIARVTRIALTGQAESLVVLGRNGRPLMNAISWMDERSTEECAELAAKFDGGACEAVTGQTAVLPTWPATKALWLARHRPELSAAATHYVLLKDYIVLRLTGRLLADCSIATFSFYFDIYGKRYWPEMLAAVGLREDQLPPLAEPCTDAGPVLPDVAARLGIPADAVVNIGTLDHFAGMIGTGNLGDGRVTLSTGTVMALAAMSPEPAPRHSGVAMHYGFLPDTHVMLAVAESGGASLEWFRRTCMPGESYDHINAVLGSRPRESSLLFLPYVVGVNAPDFNADATGVFWGLRQEHDAFDMARAIMEGVAFLLRRNCEHLADKGTPLREIMATGGGARSAIWCQLQADITGLPVLVPEEQEAACLGAAMIAAVSAGRFDSFAAAQACVRIARRHEPRPTPFLEEKYRRFLRLYEASLDVASH